MPDSQRILVVSTAATDADVARIRGGLGRNALVLAAPTAEAKQVVRTLGVEPQPEVLLAPVRFPAADRGHRLDLLVRRHALADRFRDVLVVTDPATSILLLRVLAPDQLADRLAVTVVGLPRAPRRIDVRRVLAVGLALAVVVGLARRLTPILTIPAVLALAGLVLLLVPAWRRIGRELMLAALLGLTIVLIVVSSSQRFPAA